MTGYLSRRVAQSAVVLSVLSMIGYGLLRLLPGGPVRAILGPDPAPAELARLRQDYGLGSGVVVAGYLRWLGQLLRGNLGFSFVRNEDVSALLGASLPRTLVLMLAATILAIAAAVPAGLLQAIRKDTVADRVLRGASYVLYGMPSFFLGSVLILVFAVWPSRIRLHVFGAEGPQAPGIAGVLTDWRDLTLPVLTLALVTVALYARYLRSAALDSLAEDYVRAARARGAGAWQVLSRHVLRNSVLPLISLVGLSLPRVLGGAVVVEVLFNFQGMGWQLWQAAQHHDFPVLLSFMLLIAAGAVAGSLLADVGLAVADPRIGHAAP